MADLDDFFAKKDRKKSKSIKKFATSDEIGKKLDDPKQKSDVRPKKERPAQEGDEPGRAGEEEEWKEYEETVKDYTGLKIQVLQGGGGQQGESGRDTASEDSAQGEGGKGKGPWNKGEAEQAAPPPPPQEQPEKVREVKSTAYVPPSRVRAPEPVRRNQAKHAPDIHNDDYFPQLGAGGKRGGGWSTAGAGGGAAQARTGGARQPLTLGNRFTSLQDDS